jgi:hypothetical protein
MGTSLAGSIRSRLSIFLRRRGTGYPLADIMGLEGDKSNRFPGGEGVAFSERRLAFCAAGIDNAGDVRW